MVQLTFVRIGKDYSSKDFSKQILDTESDFVEVAGDNYEFRIVFGEDFLEITPLDDMKPISLTTSQCGNGFAINQKEIL